MTTPSIETTDIALVFLGDSDMAKWPSNLLPSLTTKEDLEHHRIHQVNFNHSQSGALLSNVHTQLPKAMRELGEENNKSKRIFFIACAGENDISSGQPIDTVIQSFTSFMQSIFKETTCATRPHLIFFGPKLEPWLDDDIGSRKLYYQLSQRMLRSCIDLNSTVTEDHNNHESHDHSHDHADHLCHQHINCNSDGRNITYIDCLTMFCERGEELRTGILSGEMKADPKYFDADGLHLNEEGYAKWKEELESVLSHLICNETCGESLDRSLENIKLD